MTQALPFPIRKECPPGACVCERDKLLSDPNADLRVLRLTREEEKRLIARIEVIASFDDLKHMEQRMKAQLGIELQISPSNREVRTVRGFQIQLSEQPGLCKKLHQTLPAAVRRCLENNPEIVYAILNSHDLLGG